MTDKKRVNLNERLYITKSQLEEQEREFILKRHIERYSLARQFAEGITLDFGCGGGYGSYLMALNPDVSKLYGYDKDLHSLDFAKEQYKWDSLEYVYDTEAIGNIDTLVAIEVVEHIKDKSVIPIVAKKHNVKKVVISYPTKKTTHYNDKHFYDFERWQLEQMFGEYKLVDSFNLWHESELLVFVRRDLVGRNI